MKLTYDQCTKLASRELKLIPHGELREFARTHDLHYFNLISLRNINLAHPMPNFLCSVLVALGYSNAYPKRVTYIYFKDRNKP